MPSPLQQAGAVSEPSEYATLAMDRHITGLWTQRSLLRDADVPYLYGKFYGASRYDSLCDGINREITSRLTSARRPGMAPWRDPVTGGAGTLSGTPSALFAWKYLQNGDEMIRYFLDTVETAAFSVLWDVTNPNGWQAIFNKSVGAGIMRFCGLPYQLFMCDGIDANELLAGSQEWQASTDIDPGTLIVTNGEIVQMALGGIMMGIMQIQALNATTYQIWFDLTQTTNQFPNLIGAELTFSELTAIPALNGTSLPVGSIISTTLGILTVITTGLTAGNPMTETGAATTGNGTTGASAPAFSSTKLAVVQDSGQQWKCYGPALIPWGLQTPTQSLIILPNGQTRMWQSNTMLSYQYAIMDTNGDIQTALGLIAGAGGIYQTGNAYPTWKTGAPAGQFDQTIDGTIIWWNLGAPGSWYASQTYYVDPIQGVACILDSNQNLQWCSSGSGGASGGSEPTWNTAIGSTTADGALTWTCLGPGAILPGSEATYGYSLHGIDGTVSTASATVLIQGYVLGQAQTNPAFPSLSITIKNIQNYGSSGDASGVDQVWIWRTAQGQSTLILEDQIPIDDIQVHAAPPHHPTDGYNFLPYYEYGITDTSTNGNGALNALIIAPVADSGDAAPAGLTAPIYQLGRIWAISGNNVIYSAGPDAITGNGNTQWPPLNFIAYPEQPIRLIPFTTNNGGILVVTTTNCYVILGIGTSSNPFYTTVYMPGVGALSYDAMDIIGSTIYIFTGKSKFVSLDPSAGYTEVGFPIGDQFTNVTQALGVNDSTGNVGSGALYNPATVHVSWYEGGSGDTAIFVSDGEYGWFRYSPVASPESGYLWSPRAVLVTRCKFAQALELQPGIFGLIGVTSSGAMLLRNAPYSPNAMPCTDGIPVLSAPTSSLGSSGSGKFPQGDFYATVVAFNSSNDVIGISAETVFQAPTGLTREIIWTWSAVAGASYYQLWMGGKSTVYSRYEQLSGVNFAQTAPVENLGGATGGIFPTQGSYPSYQTIGNITLCQSGEIVEIAHVALKSVATGARPAVGLLIGELAATTAVPFDNLEITSNDPPDLPASQTMYSDRYTAMQNGVCPLCDNMQVKMDYGTQPWADELLMHSIYGAHHAERKQQ